MATIFNFVHFNDNLNIAKTFFNLIHEDGYFLDVVCTISKKHGFVINDIGCMFPDLNSYYDEDHFEGVEFFLGDQTLIVEEAVFFQLLKSACNNYIHIHPEHKDIIAENVMFDI